MGTEHLSAVFDHAGRGGSHLVILLTIATYSDPHGEWITKQATLQKRARLGRRRVQDLLGDLVAAGELAVIPGKGRGNRSIYRLILPTKSASQATLTLPSSAIQTALSNPPCPPFPPHPQSPLNPPQNLETYGLHASSPLSVSPLPFGEGGSGAHGRGAGGEGEIRPLTPAQSAAFRVRLLLEEATVPLPTPSQIGLWSKTLGGIEPLLELLRQLIEAGLATKREPIVYAHRVVMERAARPQPAPRATNRAANKELLRTAGVDDIRRAQAASIAAERGDE